MIAILTIAQALLMAVLLFGDIGFDRPGRFGMSFGHGILLSFLYLVVLVFGIVYSCVKRKWYTLFSQTMIPLLVIVYTSWPVTRYDAHEYQRLLQFGDARVADLFGQDRPLQVSPSFEAH